MLPLPRGAVWQMLFLLSAVLLINEVRSEGRVVCYYTNWSVYRPGTAKFNPQNINPYLCTHLVYAFGGFTKDNQMKPFDKYQDIEQGGYAKFTGLKTYNKQLKTMIAIGGWNEASSRFSPLMANPERRQKFIKNILKFLRQNHFDGIDLDWEYPAHREGGKERDRDNYAQFVQELRAEFEREAEKTGRTRLLVTMAVPAGTEYIEKGYDIPKLNKYLDWFNVLTYDFHSSHEPSANHHAPLYSLEEESEYNFDSELNIDYSIKFYLKAGADRDKLVLGIPTYGRSYTLINEESNEIGAPSEGPGEQGDATREKGYLAYYEICQNLKDDPEWTVVQPNPNAMGPYAYRRNQWVGYDDEAIVRKKAEYVVEHGLGGIMFWAIDNDDFRGICTGKPYPLIEAAKESMLDSLRLGINEVSKPNAPKKPSRSRSRDQSSDTRNRISEDAKTSISSSRRPATSGGRKRVQSSPTSPPSSTTIKLTEVEGSSLYIGGRTTPAPPTTPDPGTDFKCEEEGFFQHPRDCKKYYWCLDSGPSGLGIVAHQFTCPSGLYFNPAADSCDFARNVPCKTKKSTTAAPVTTTSTTTTARPTAAAAVNRITAATSRTSFFRTTTTTTPAPEEDEDEYEEDVEAPAHTKDKEAEEDPKVIKELIELIRKVGGIEELEKHLLRKDDGTISLKEQNAATGAGTTSSPISKTIYDKVLSRPGTYNSFRNRFTSSTLFRNSGRTEQSKSEEVKTRSNFDSEEENESRTDTGSSSYSKYSSVVRGNSRQGPQNEGLDKLADFDSFLKEKKQYVTINRNRGSTKVRSEEEQEDEIEEQEVALDDETKTRNTKRPLSTVTPSYVNIRRNRPTTTTTTPESQEAEEEVKVNKEVGEKRTYTSLSRGRVRLTTTTEEPAVNEESTTSANRYKFTGRTRPTKLTSIFNAKTEDKSTETAAVNENDDDDDDKNRGNINSDDEQEQDEEEQQQNVTVQLRAGNDSTQKSQTTTRYYASIGRRTTTTTTPDNSTPITTTTNTTTTDTIETPTKTNNLETNLTNETPEPISITTTTTTTTDTDTISTTTTTNPIISTTNSPITSTSASYSTTTTLIPNNESPNADNSIEITTQYPSDSQSSVDNFVSNEALNLSLDINSLVRDQDNQSKTATQQTTTTTTDSGIVQDTTTNTLTGTGTTDDTDRQQPSNELRTTIPTSSNNPTFTTITRRPVLSVRRRIVNTPIASKAPTTTAASNGGDSTTTDSTSATVKYSRLRNRPGATLAAAAITTTTTLTAGTPAASSPTTHYVTPTIATTFINKNILNTKLKSTKYPSVQANTVGIAAPTAAATSSPTSANDITQRFSTKYPSTTLRRNKFQSRRFTTTTTASPSDEFTEQSRTQNPLFKRRYSLTTTVPTTPTLFTPITGSVSTTTTTSAPQPTTTSAALPTEFDALTTTLYVDSLDGDEASDQIAKSSIHTSRFNKIADELENDADIESAKPAPTALPQTSYQFEEVITRRMGFAAPVHSTTTATTTTTTTTTAATPTSTTNRKPNIRRRPQKTTPTPVKSVTAAATAAPIRRRRPNKYADTLNRLNGNQASPVKAVSKAPGRTYRPTIDYDYYDDEDARVVGKTQGQLKVILHGRGIIECLDQGNFPHPLSCRKFISCAKFETGGVVGWEYTCPKGLSYDPVGGMCNWAAGLGCKE